MLPSAREGCVAVKLSHYAVSGIVRPLVLVQVSALPSSYAPLCRLFSFRPLRWTLALRALLLPDAVSRQ